MENKINIAELLKDCPQGMELDCASYEDVYFDYVDELNIIHCYIQHETHKTSLTFNQHGTPNSDIKSKCVIFPKGKTTWEGFQKPFEDGDIISNGAYVAIFHKIGTPCNCTSPNVVYYHCYYSPKFRCFKKEVDFGIGISTEFKYATEEEKQKLFDVIKANGYKWNEETKTLKKLSKFKVGDRVKHISAYTSGIVVKVDDKGYHIDYPKGEGVCYISFTLEKDYELSPQKFDINILIPFESKVLVRSSMDGLWKPAVFGFRNGYNDNAFYIVGGSCWKQCIPYLNNEHLCGTTNDCDEFYKTWE